MKNLKAGIVGAGGIADYHISGYLKSGVNVVAISDIDTQRAKVKAEKFNIKNVYSSYKEMLEKEKDLDIVSVCVPNKYHAEISIECLKNGINVFCEKPPALNAKETEEMVKTAKEAKKTLMFDFNNRARPEAQALMKYIKNGEVGRINSAQALWIRRCGIPGFGGWFTQKALSGGGPVIDLLHMIDLALYFMEFPEPDYVLAKTFYDFSGNPDFKGPWGIPDVEGGLMDVETSSHAFITFKTGQVLFARNSWAEMNKREEVSVTFQGTKAGGMIRRLFGRDGIDDTAIDTCELYTMENGKPVNRKIIVEPDPKMGRERAVINFVKTIKGEEEPFSKPEEAIILMKIIDAIYKSSEENRPVKIE
ncbi:MAG: Gfo/Idh/MocA family oxidoreductase [Candidatus Omnitrophica bacterium]|nr:Gfo/Idh/MocA family oxidoreductase [Candidatus Omnitrophota bacterium]MCM8806849.1 Gfo/Idh/MocA family oxidoreductase [Candidatus Omnitrophota bacterium]